MQHCAVGTGIYPVIVDVIWRDIFTGVRGYLARISCGVCLAVIALRSAIGSQCGTAGKA